MTLLLVAARWSPNRPWIVIAIGLLMMTPAALALAFEPTALQRAWMVWSRSETEFNLGIEHEGLSRNGFEILAIGAAGFVIAAYSTLAWLGQRAAPAGPPRKLRVHEAEQAERPEEVTGTARLATAQLESPIGGSPCLAFGLRGELDGVEVDDAEGGDFDVVLPSGEVVMVSLEHALLLPADDAESISLTPAEAPDLEELLLTRVGKRFHDSCTLAETILGEGDTVTVQGRFRGRALGVAPFRDAARGTVLGGEPEEPLIIRVVSRAADASA